MGYDYVDSSGWPRAYGEGFVDASGIYRSWGEGFVDASGIYRSWGEGFVDYDNQYRRFGEGFVDGDKVWREPKSSLNYLDLNNNNSNDNSQAVHYDNEYDPVDFSSITSDDVLKGISVFENLFKYIIALCGIYIAFAIEPVIFIILIITKKIRKQKQSKMLKFAVIISGVATIEWLVAVGCLYFLNQEIFIHINSILSNVFIY